MSACAKRASTLLSRPPLTTVPGSSARSSTGPRCPPCNVVTSLAVAEFQHRTARSYPPDTIKRPLADTSTQDTLDEWPTRSRHADPDLPHRHSLLSMPPDTRRPSGRNLPPHGHVVPKVSSTTTHTQPCPTRHPTLLQHRSHISDTYLRHVTHSECPWRFVYRVRRFAPEFRSYVYTAWSEQPKATSDDDTSMHMMPRSEQSMSTPAGSTGPEYLTSRGGGGGGGGGT
mgnify:CR=1 FL=1